MAQNGWIPQGSILQPNPDNTLTIIPPQGWIYVGTTTDGNALTVAGGQTTICCDCNTTGSCNPFTGSGPGGSTSGCAGTCTNCTMTQSVAAGGIDFLSGGYLNLAAEPAIIQQGDLRPGPFKEMYNVPEVQQKIQQFINSIYHGQPVPELTEGPNFVYAPEGYTLVFVDIAGRAVILPVPDSAVTAAAAAGGKASCSCSNGSCTLESTTIPLVGSVKYCEGNCSGTCCLSTRIASTDQETYAATCFAY